jgi:uncharacterized protein YcbK (DUF882 family)
LLTAISGIFPSRILASVEDLLSEERVLSLYNLHYKEDLHTVYYRNGEYIPDSLKEINHIFRDHYNGRVKNIDLKLIDFLYAIRKNLNSTKPFHIISGYRTKKTNSYLSTFKGGVSKNSLHIKGMAVDIRMPGFKLRDLRRAAYELKAGGVGYYPKSNFVHVDVGRVRYW